MKCFRWKFIRHTWKVTLPFHDVIHIFADKSMQWLQWLHGSAGNKARTNKLRQPYSNLLYQNCRKRIRQLYRTWWPGGSQLQNNNVWSNVTNNLRRANLTFVISQGDEGVQPSSLHAHFTRRFVRALNVPKGAVVSLLFQFEPSRKTVVTPGSRWTRLTVSDHENEDLLATDDKGTTIPETSKTTAWHPKRFVRLSFIHLPQSPVQVTQDLTQFETRQAMYV